MWAWCGPGTGMDVDFSTSLFPRVDWHDGLCRPVLTTRLVCFLLQTRRVLYTLRRRPRAPHFNWRSNTMLPLEESIFENLGRSGPCSFDEIVTYLPS
jgi:hypothetical protein